MQLKNTTENKNGGIFMKWYEEAIFYHIYPIGMCGCAKENDGATCENHFDQLNAWAEHVKKLGCNGIYIGPLFESVGHGYETTDYKMVDRRLGTNDDFKEYVKHCHDIGIKVIVDGVFNHVGREFFALKDLKANRESSKYRDWFCNVNFHGNNEYNDGFCYDNWGGYNLLVKLNQRNPEVKNYLFDVVRFWVSEFDIDGIRLDAADVLDHDFMRELRGVTNTIKEDFWLMGEVIHGDYSRWANGETLHSVTNYELHKALFSGHNDHNYFEIAHSIQRSLDINGNTRLYTFVDNHDVARIASKLNNKEHLLPVHVLYYGLPGIPSIYYGSEFGIEGKKDKNGPDDDIRPALDLKDFANAYEANPLTNLICKLGAIHQQFPELTEGRYEQLHLTNRQFAYGRILNDSAVIVAVNNDDNPSEMWIKLPIGANKAVDLLKAEIEEPSKEDLEALEQEQKDLVLQKGKDLLVDISTKTETYQAAFSAYEQALKEAELNDTITAYTSLQKAAKELNDALQTQSLSLQKPKPVLAADSEVRIENGQLVVKLEKNSGTMIRIFND